MKNKKVESTVVEKQETKKEQKIIIEDIVPVRNQNGEVTHIDIILDDGTSLPVPNTKSSLLHFRDIMLKQAREQRELIKGKNIQVNAYRVMALVGAAGFVLVNTTQFGKEIGPLAPSIISGAISLGSGIGAIVENKKLSRIQRNVTFACHKDEINKVICENPYVYQDIADKDKKLIELWLETYRGEPIVIENLSMLNPQTIHQIWKNIKLYKHFNFEYKADGKIEEPGFQKINLPKEQSK